MSTPQEHASRIAADIRASFPTGDDACGFLLGCLIKTFDAMGMTDAQMLNAFDQGIKALRKGLEKSVIPVSSIPTYLYNKVKPS